ncbi:hypothetical protein GCM10010442_44090 [Kitasatospora kifunensis]
MCGPVGGTGWWGSGDSLPGRAPEGDHSPRRAARPSRLRRSRKREPGPPTRPKIGYACPTEEGAPRPARGAAAAGGVRVYGTQKSLQKCP